MRDARIEILDFSASRNSGVRTLKQIDARDIPKLSHNQVNSMLETFVEGYELAKTELANLPERSDSTGESKSEVAENQIQLI